MAALNHTQARAFIQSAADQRLSVTDARDLQDHLRGCRECREYRDGLAAVADALPRAWHARSRLAILKSSSRIPFNCRCSRRASRRFTVS